MSKITYLYPDTELSLQEALAAFSESCPGQAYGLLYSPSDCQVAELRDGRLVTACGPADTNFVFEARIFSEDFELRWLAPGRAALIAAKPLQTPQGWKLEELEVESSPNHYLLWGSGTGKYSAGWGGVSSSRTGVIPLPLDVPKGKTVLLHTVEYFAANDESGNYAPCDERLVKLEVCNNEDK